MLEDVLQLLSNRLPRPVVTRDHGWAEAIRVQEQGTAEGMWVRVIYLSERCLHVCAAPACEEFTSPATTLVLVDRALRKLRT